MKRNERAGVGAARVRKTAASFTIRVEEPAWRTDDEAVTLVRRAVRRALAACPQPAREVTILLTSDQRLHALNREFRRQDRPTNVLSFPGDANGFYLGDVAIAYGVVAREADRQGKSLSAHAAHLALHGVLHLLGYDHESAEDAAAMEAKETAVLADLGIPDPYAPRPYTKVRKALH